MSSRSTTSRSLFAALIVMLAGSLAWSGCSHEKEYIDEEGPTTGEVEVEKDEIEYEAEKELPEDESRPTGEYETKYGEVEIEEDEIEVEGEREFPGGNNPAYGGGPSGDNENAQIEIGQPNPQKAIAVTKVYAAPVDFVGATVVGKAKATKVISDRGFWVNHNGEKIFAVVREDVPSHEMIDIDKGQRLKFGGVLVDGDNWEQVAGNLEPQTKKTLKEQPYFIAVHWDNIEIMNN